MKWDYDEDAYEKYVEDCKKADKAVEQLELHRKRLEKETRFHMFWWNVGWHIDWLLLPVSIPILIWFLYLANTGYFE